MSRIPLRSIDDALECLAFGHSWERTSPNLERGTGKSSSTVWRLYHRCVRCGSDKYTSHDFYGRSIGSGVIIPSPSMIEAKNQVAVHRTDVDFTVRQQYRQAYFRSFTRTEAKARRLKVVE